MTRDEWIDWNFGKNGVDDPKIINQVDQSKERFLTDELNRGWRAKQVCKIGNLTWNTDMIGCDMFNPALEVIEWCETYCEGNWHASDPIHWHFELETDVIAFKLVWGV